MVHPCDKPCGNKTASGYCATTVCINPQYSRIGTAQYGQGVKKRIVTNADRIRGYTDEELAEWLKKQACLAHNYGYECADGEPDFPDGLPANYDYLTWLKKEAKDGKTAL